MLGGYCGKILRINLTNREVKEERLPEEYLRKYLGGSGIGARLLYDMTDENTDPLGPENPLIYMTGPFAGTSVPTSGRHQIVAKSPLTGIYGEGDVGGTWGAGLKKCGYDGIVIEGQSQEPVYIVVEEGKASILDAGFLWGKDTYEADEILKETHGKNISVSCIGPAGEKLVRLASIMHDGKDGRAVGRTGLGAVMGSKKLKAVVVSGNLPVRVIDEAKLKDSIKEISPTIVKNTNAIKQHGTAAGVIGTEAIGDFPLKNWSYATWDKIENVSGQRMTQTILTGRYFCGSCIIGCGREVEVKEGPFAMKGAGPEYETIGTLGGLCLVDNLEAIAHGAELCNRYGIDTISTGSVIGFAMELYEKGIIDKDDTGGIELTWGNAYAMVEMIHRIGKKEGIGDLLGNGVREVARQMGGRAQEYAIHVKGLEFPAHDPRAFNSLALGYATANRGACHLQGASYFFEKTATMPELGIPEPKERHRADDQGEFQKNTQDLMCLMDSLKLCKFTLYGGVKTAHMREWIRYVVGWDISFEELMAIGERIFNLKRMYNVKCGISRKDDTLPPRILTQPGKEGETKHNLPHFGRMLNEYYIARGWDDDGIPTQETLERLGLTW
jgi:aldehyde:ferredoxin oxidoreductase